MFRLLTLLPALLATASAAGSSYTWTYEDSYGNGPSSWSNFDSSCQSSGAGGKFTAPILFEPNSGDVTKTSLVTLSFAQSKQSEAIITNDGHTVYTTFTSTGGSSSPMTLTVASDLATGLKSAKKYCLRSMDWHWGKNDEAGSEHWIKYAPSPLELQFQFYDCATYGSYDAAEEKAKSLTANTDDATLVGLSVLYDVGTTYNTYLPSFYNYFATIRSPSTSYTIPVISSVLTYDLTNLMPSTRTYYTYVGQQTTPPCYQKTWIVFDNKMTMTTAQASVIRAAIQDSAYNTITQNTAPSKTFTKANALLNYYS